MTWTVTVSLPTTTGEIATHDIAGAGPVRGIAYTVRAKTDQPTPDWDDRLAIDFFDSGKDLDVVCQTRGINSSGRADSYAVKRLKQWLMRFGVVDPGKRIATLDQPAEVRQALARGLRQEPDCTLYEQLMGNIYRDPNPWSSSWVAVPCGPARDLLDAVVSIGDDDVDTILVIQRAKLTWSEFLAVTANQRVTRRGGISYNVGPALIRNWGRGATPQHGRKLTSHRCPHRDCLSIKKNRTPGILIQLVVPELGPTGLLCRDCLRRPSDSLTVLPEVYLDRWIGGRRTCVTDANGARLLGSHVERQQAD